MGIGDGANSALAGVKDKAAGLFSATVLGFDEEKCTATVAVNNQVNNPIEAGVMRSAGGAGGTEGVSFYPSKEDLVYVMYDGAENPSVPIVVGYVQPTKAGTNGVTPGDYVITTANNLTMALRDSVDQIDLSTSAGYGLSVTKTKLTIKSQSFVLSSDQDISSISMNNDCRISYIPKELPKDEDEDDEDEFGSGGKTSAIDTSAVDGLAAGIGGAGGALGEEEEIPDVGELIIEAPRFIHLTDDVFTSTTSRTDFIGGSWYIGTGGSFKISSGNFSVTSSSTINMANAPKRFGIVTGTYSLVANKNIILTSQFRNIYAFTSLGNITLAAGAATTEEMANTAGIVFAMAYIELTQTGTITIDNVLASTKYTLAGKIDESAIAGFSGEYFGPFVIDALAKLDITCKVIATIDAKVKLTLSSAIEVSIDSKVMITVKALYTEIKSTLVDWKIAVPMGGLQVITILGPQMIMPG